MTIIEPVVQAKADIFTPVILIVWVSYIIISPLLTWAYKSNRTGWGNYWKVYIWTVVLTGILVGFITFSPETIANLFSVFTK